MYFKKYLHQSLITISRYKISFIIYFIYVIVDKISKKNLESIEIKYQRVEIIPRRMFILFTENLYKSQLKIIKTSINHKI